MAVPLHDGASPAPSAVDSVIHQPPSQTNQNQDDMLESTSIERNWTLEHHQSIAKHCQDYKNAIEVVSAAVLYEPVKSQELFNDVLDDLVEDMSSANLVVKLQQMLHWSTTLPSAIESLNRLHLTLEDDLESMHISGVDGKRDSAVEKYTEWLRHSGARVMAAGSVVLSLAKRLSDRSKHCSRDFDQVEQKSQWALHTSSNIYRDHIQTGHTPAEAKRAMMRYFHTRTLFDAKVDIETLHMLAADGIRQWVMAEKYVKDHMGEELESAVMGDDKRYLFETLEMREDAILKAARWALQCAEWRRTFEEVVEA